MALDLSRPSVVIEAQAPSEYRALNQLEVEAAVPEAQASDVRWKQAEEVKLLRASGKTHRDIAANWISARSGKPVSHVHVLHVERTWNVFGNLSYQDRPPFNEAYNSPEVRGKAHVGQASGQNEWYTPAEYIEAARQVMGGIDLDPASCEIANDKYIHATKYYSIENDGLRKSWFGRVWMNPPYAQPLIAWFCTKLVEEFDAGNVTQACVLVNNATETEWFQSTCEAVSAVCFPNGRVQFWHPERKSAPLQGQAVLYLGPNYDAFANAFDAFGMVLYR